jgi:hypothetical protein
MEGVGKRLDHLQKLGTGEAGLLRVLPLPYQRHRCASGEFGDDPKLPSQRVDEARRLGQGGVELLAGLALDDLDEPCLVGFFASGGSRTRSMERLISGPCLERRQEGEGVEDDCPGVRLEILTSARCVELAETPDVLADVQPERLALLTQDVLLVRDLLPLGRRDRSELSRTAYGAIDGLDAARSPLLARYRR